MANGKQPSSDTEDCHIDGMMLAKAFLIKHCASKDEFRSVFNSNEEFPSDIAYGLGIVNKAFDKLKEKFG